MQEIRSLKEEYVYFIGKTMGRIDSYINKVKGKNEASVKKGFDDEEGYYNVILGDHLIFRYEILKILGKGSFA